MNKTAPAFHHDQLTLIREIAEKAIRQNAAPAGELEQIIEITNRLQKRKTRTVQKPYVFLSNLEVPFFSLYVLLNLQLHTMRQDPTMETKMEMVYETMASRMGVDISGGTYKQAIEKMQTLITEKMGWTARRVRGA